MDKKKKIEILLEMAKTHFSGMRVYKTRFLDRIRVFGSDLVAGIAPNGNIDLYSESYYNSALGFKKTYQKEFEKDPHIFTHY